jgi:hypothetical protein
MNRGIVLLALSLLFCVKVYSVGDGVAIPAVENIYFYNEFEGDPADTTNTPQSLEEKAEGLLAFVKANNRLVGALIPNQSYPLPIGIQKSIGGIEYIIVLDDMVIDPGGGWLKAYMTIQFPGTDRKIGFYADSIRAAPLNIVAAQLTLIREQLIDFGAFEMVLKPGLTKVQMDCNGYSGTTIGGDIVFNSSIIKPIDGSQTMVSPFLISFTDFSDVLFGIAIQPFEINGLPDFQFHPGSVFLDFSDLRNPQAMAFPVNYFPQGTPENLKVLWRGVYIPNFTMKLPPGISPDENNPIAISGEKLIIDSEGITGGIFANNILPLEQGNIGGWQFSIEKFGFTLLKNSFSNFQLIGQIKVPISSGNKGFAYSTIFDANKNLFLTVSPDSTISASMWGAELKLFQNSTIELMKVGNRYNAKAVLHGTMKIDISSKVNLVDCNFESLTVQTFGTRLSVGHFEMTNGILSNFPIQISNIGLTTQGDNVGLSLTAYINLMESSNGGFGGGCGLTIWAEQKEVNGKTKYEYKRTQVNSITIDVDQGAFAFHGTLNLYQDHQVFGKGFKGMVNASFKPGIAVAATAQFGNVNGYRYWYVDALVATSSGIPIAPGVSIYGFGGGASYRMQRVEPNNPNFPTVNISATDTTAVPGISLSGVNYVPNQTYGLGLKATVIIGSQGSPKAFNGMVSFLIQFNSGGGISYIQFLGQAVMVADIGTNPTTAPFRLNLDISYNFANQQLYGNNTIYINVANTLKGTGSQNLAGSVVFLFNPQQWYIYVGTPDQRIGLKLFNVVSLTSYMVAGTTIPPFPTPPANVTSILKASTQNFDNALLASGGGFGFGSNFTMDTGDQEFLIFFGQFAIGAGFDIMLRNLGTTAYCQGSQPPIGVNGWYAMGQAYAFINGNIGIKVALFSQPPKRFPILNIAAAALLQAQLPNPVFINGQISGNYNILNGLVKGSCNFEFSYGNNCVPAGVNAMGSMTVISDLSPSANSTDVNVFVTPQAAFNLSIDYPFQLLDLNNVQRSYRAKLSYFKVLVNGIQFPGNLTWNADKNVASFETTEIYPEYTTVSLDVKVIFEQLVNGAWVPYLVSGQPQVEQKTLTFTTGARPNNILPNTISYSYPVPQMVNFHWQEHPTGYIKLTHNYEYLLNPESGWRGVVLFQGAGAPVEVQYAYNATERKITFPIPSNLNPNIIYNMRLSKLSTEQTAAIDSNVEDVVVVATTELEQSEKEIEGERMVFQERILHQLNLRTSAYSTFAAKIDATNYGSTVRDIVMTGVHNLILFAYLPEGFDSYEIEGIAGNPMLKIELEFANNYWFETYINPLVYANYPRLPGLTISYRDVAVLGVPPTKAGSIYQLSNSISISNLPTGTYKVNPASDAGLKNYCVFIMNQDCADLKSRACSQYVPGGANASIYLHLINGKFQPIILERQYNGYIKYVLPGENIVTTVKEIVFSS